MYKQLQGQIFRRNRSCRKSLLAWKSLFVSNAERRFLVREVYLYLIQSEYLNLRHPAYFHFHQHQTLSQHLLQSVRHFQPRRFLVAIQRMHRHRPPHYSRHQVIYRKENFLLHQNFLRQHNVEILSSFLRFQYRCYLGSYFLQNWQEFFHLWRYRSLSQDIQSSSLP